MYLRREMRFPQVPAELKRTNLNDKIEYQL